MISKTTFFLMLAIGAALGTAIAPWLLTSALAKEHVLCTGPDVACAPPHTCKSTGSPDNPKCVPGSE